MSMKCGLIGHKLGHSFSPRIHRELADYSYELFELEREELGRFFEEAGDLEEAIIWYYNAAYSVQPILVKVSGDKEPIEGLLRCYQLLENKEQEIFYRNELIRLIAEGK